MSFGNLFYLAICSQTKKVAKRQKLWISCSVVNLLKYEICNTSYMAKCKLVQQTLKAQYSIYAFSILTKPWPYSDIISSCCWSLHVFTFRHDYTLLGHTFVTPKVFLHHIITLVRFYAYRSRTAQKVGLVAHHILHILGKGTIIC